MATTVATVMTNARSIASSVLGATYQQMRFVIDPLKNDQRSAEKAYGIHPLEMETAESVTRVETVKHYFNFVMSDTVARVDSDAAVLSTLETIYDKMDQIFKQFVVTKMNMASQVVQVDERFMEVPIITPDLVIIRMRFWVKYRQDLT